MDVETVQPVDDSLSALFGGFAEMTSGYEPNEFIGIGFRPPDIASRFVTPFSGKLRMKEPSNKPAVLPPEFRDLGYFARSLLAAVSFLDRLLPNVLYDLFLLLLLNILRGVERDREGKVGEDLDVAVSSLNVVEPHLTGSIHTSVGIPSWL